MGVEGKRWVGREEGSHLNNQLLLLWRRKYEGVSTSQTPSPPPREQCGLAPIVIINDTRLFPSSRIDHHIILLTSLFFNAYRSYMDSAPSITCTHHFTRTDLSMLITWGSRYFFCTENFIIPFPSPSSILSHPRYSSGCFLLSESAMWKTAGYVVPANI